MNNLAIFDLDGTIIPFPDQYKLEGSEFNWPNFMNWMDEQKAYTVSIEMMRFHRLNGTKVVVVTARPESYRERTIALLKRIGFHYDELIMRSDDLIEQEIKQLAKVRGADEIKSILFTNHSNWRVGVKEYLIESGDSIKYAYDDQSPNLVVWKSAGASCFLVEDGMMLPFRN